MAGEQDIGVANEIVCYIYGDPWPELAQAIATALANARREERERCAMKLDEGADLIEKAGMACPDLRAGAATLRSEGGGGPPKKGDKNG